MKTLKNILIAIFIFGILSPGFSQKPTTKQKFILQSTDQTLSADALKKSAEIITARLKSFSNQKFDVITNADKNQIQVITKGKWDAKITENLLTQKGSLEFYETWNNKQFKALINDHAALSALLPDEGTFDSSPKLGCTSYAEMFKVNSYLNSKGIDQKCKFVWSDLFEDSVVCVYALKLNNGDGILLRGCDVERFKEKYEPTQNKDSFVFTFKAPAIGKWAEITKRNLNSAIAIAMDDHLILAPMITSEITGGDCQVTGDFSIAEVKYIVAIGNNEELPAGFKIVK